MRAHRFIPWAAEIFGTVVGVAGLSCEGIRLEDAPPGDPEAAIGGSLSQEVFRTEASILGGHLTISQRATITVGASSAAEFCWPMAVFEESEEDNPLLALCMGDLCQANIRDDGIGQKHCVVVDESSAIRDTRVYQVIGEPSNRFVELEVAVDISPLNGSDVTARTEIVVVRVEQPNPPLFVDLTGPTRVRVGDAVRLQAVIRGGLPIDPPLVCACQPPGFDLGESVGGGTDTPPSTYCAFWTVDNSNLVNRSVPCRLIREAESGCMTGGNLDLNTGTELTQEFFCQPESIPNEARSQVSTLECEVPAADVGFVDFSVTVCDAEGTTVSRSLPVQVASAESLIASSRLTPSIIQPGGQSTLEITPNGGLGPYCIRAEAVVGQSMTRIQLRSPMGQANTATGCDFCLEGGCFSGRAEGTITAELEGSNALSGDVRITVRDRAGTEIESSRSIAVRSNLTLAVTAIPSSLVPGGNSMITATIVHGPHEALELAGAPIPANLYTYEFMGTVRTPTKFSTASRVETASFHATGIAQETATNLVEVVVTDLSGARVSESVPIVIITDDGLALTVEGPTTIANNDNLPLTARVFGGLGNVTLVWTANPMLGTFTPASCVPDVNKSCQVAWNTFGVSNGKRVTLTVTATDSQRPGVLARADHVVQVGSSLACGPPIPSLAMLVQSIGSLTLRDSSTEIRHTIPLSGFDPRTAGTDGETLFWMEHVPATGSPFDIMEIELKPKKPYQFNVGGLPIEPLNQYLTRAYGEVIFRPGAYAAIMALNPQPDFMGRTFELPFRIQVLDRCSNVTTTGDFNLSVTLDP